MIAGADVGLDDAARRARGDRLRREDVVDPPADIALAHVAPWRPPREKALVGGIERATDVDEMAAEELVEQLALLGALPDDPRLSLLRVDVDFDTRYVQVAADHELASRIVQLAGPCGETLEECELGRIVLAAVRHVDRCDNPVADLDLDDARLHVELGVTPLRIGVEQVPAHMQGHAGITSAAVPVRVVVGELAALGTLRRLRLDLLQADDIRLVALEPVADLRLPRANAVDVPGRNLHRGACHRFSAT